MKFKLLAKKYFPNKIINKLTRTENKAIINITLNKTNGTFSFLMTAYSATYLLTDVDIPKSPNKAKKKTTVNI